MIKTQMDDKTVFYFYGNWKHVNGYIGEPQRTLQLLIKHLKKTNKTEMLSDLSKAEKTNGNYIILIFGDFFSICLRTFFCLFYRVSFAKIKFILFKDKVCFSDIVFFLRNIDSFKKIKYIKSISVLESLIPEGLYRYLISAYAKKIFAIFFPSDIIDRSRIFLCSCLEKNYLQRFVFSHKINFNKKEIKILYFGRDSYLRGVDMIQELNGIHKGYSVSCAGIFPFRGFLSQIGSNSQYHIYDNDQNILRQVREATFTFFPFRTKLAGPDVPAALIESFLLGIPPIISKVLLFDILKRHNYPLVIDQICVDSVRKCIEENVKSNEDYEKIVSLCYLISKDIISSYSYSFAEINV